MAKDLPVIAHSAPPRAERSTNKLGQSVDVYEMPRKNLSVTVARRWLLDNVLQDSSTAHAGYVFRDGANQEIIKLLAAHLPPQLALACLNSRISAGALGAQTWTKRWYCSAPGCPSKLETSSDIESASDIKLRVLFSDGPCSHIANSVYGQLRGKQRAEWARLQLGAHRLQLEAVQSVPADRFLTGNMSGVPQQSSAQRLASERRTKLRRHADLLTSLQRLSEEADMGPWIRQISMKPASVLLVSEGELAVCTCLLIVSQRVCAVVSVALHARAGYLHRCYGRPCSQL